MRFTTVLQAVTVFLKLQCDSCPCAALPQKLLDLLNKSKSFNSLVEIIKCYLIYFYHSVYCLFSFGQNLLFMVVVGFWCMFLEGNVLHQVETKCTKIAVRLAS